MINESPEGNDSAPQQEPAILVNPSDGAVAVDERDRTVLLTENETIIVEKSVWIDWVPANRPRRVYLGMWGKAEISAVAAASLAILMALFLFLAMTLPARREVERNKATRDRVEAELTAARARYGDITNTETQVAKLLASVDDFETRYLPIASIGQTSLYQNLNALIQAYGLVNTSGPDYSPLELSGNSANGESEEARGRARLRSMFPGTYVTMTVEGPYPNLRRFIRDLETGRDFIVIGAIELSPAESPTSAGRTNPPVQSGESGKPTTAGNLGIGQPITRPLNPPPAQPRGKTQGAVVSLRIELAAYYRRPAAAPFGVR